MRIADFWLGLMVGLTIVPAVLVIAVGWWVRAFRQHSKP